MQCHHKGPLHFLHDQNEKKKTISFHNIYFLKLKILSAAMQFVVLSELHFLPEIFPFTKWKFSLPDTWWNFFVLPSQFVASLVRLLHTRHVSLVYVWKRKNSDLTRRGNVMENLPTWWRFFRNPMGLSRRGVILNWGYEMKQSYDPRILVTRESDLMAAHDPRLWEKSDNLDLTAHALRGNRK